MFIDDNHNIELVKVKRLNEDFEINLYTSIVNLFMQGDMPEWSNSVPIGEVHTFDAILLETSDDSNIKELLTLHHQIGDIITKLG